MNKLYMKFLKRNPGYSGKVCSSIVHDPFTMFFIIAIMLIIRQEIFCPILQVSLYGHSLGSVLSYDILCHQESLWAPFPTEYLNMETSDRSQGAKSANKVALHGSGTKDHDTSTLRHSCADNAHGVVNEDSTITDASHMDNILPSCVLEDSPNNHEIVVPRGAVVAEQNEEENEVDNRQMVYTEEGTTSGVSTKDDEGSSISRSAEEAHQEVLEEKSMVRDKDKLIISLEEEV